MFLSSFDTELNNAITASHRACSKPGNAQLDTPRLASLDNFRDIAGTIAAHTTCYGTLRSMCFYRSNAVTPSAADMAILEQLGIRAIFDLRDDHEIETAPDLLPKGAIYRHFNVLRHRFKGFDLASLRLESAEQTSALMRDVNRDFVVCASAREVLGEVLTAMAQTQGPVLFHCSAGKDRTGWVSALLLSIAGADHATLMYDYLASNAYTAQRIAATLAGMPESRRAIYAPALTVDARYLNAALEQVTRDYGDMDNYLHNGLNLSHQTLSTLRSKLVV